MDSFKVELNNLEKINNINLSEDQCTIINALRIKLKYTFGNKMIDVRDKGDDELVINCWNREILYAINEAYGNIFTYKECLLGKALIVYFQFFEENNCNNLMDTYQKHYLKRLCIIEDYLKNKIDIEHLINKKKQLIKNFKYEESLQLRREYNESRYTY